MKKLFLVFLFLFFIIYPGYIRAEECRETNADMDEATLQAIKDACEAKIAANKSEQNTLKQAISSINAKINLAQAQINQTNAQIKELEKEIIILEGVLETVNESMDDLSVIYLARVRESYRRSRVGPIDLIFTSENFADFFTRIKYLNTVKAKDQLILMELEKSRLDYDARKQEKITKQEEIEKLKSKLIAQKKLLGSQQAEKQNLLQITQSDEKKYQQLLFEAKNQLAAIRRFVVGQGGASILTNQTKCNDWGCYYNQRDSIWGNLNLGNSTYSVAEYGCLVSSVSMMASHTGKNIKPNDIANTPSAFVPGYGWLLHSFNVNGINVSITKASKSILDSELNAGRPVIAGLFSGPDHFIVILKKEGDNYIMNDPFLENGANRPLTDKYKVSDITSLRLISFN